VHECIAARRATRTSTQNVHLNIYIYIYIYFFFSKIKNRYFCLFFRAKPIVFGVLVGFCACWPIGVTAALSGRLLHQMAIN
jgi:hypothetical protein